MKNYQLFHSLKHLKNSARRRIFRNFRKKQWQRNFYFVKHPETEAGFSENFSIYSSPLKNYQHSHSLRATGKFGAPKNFQKFSPGAMAEKFSFCEAPRKRGWFFRKSFHPFLPVKNYQFFHSLKHLRKFGASKDFQKFSPEAMAEIFLFCEAPRNRGWFFSESFHLFLPTEKLPTFSFSEAPKKIRRVEGFSEIFVRNNDREIFILRSTRKTSRSENFSIHLSPVKNYQYFHSLKHLRKFGAPKDSQKFS